MFPISGAYTATMASVLADQGYWRKAADIYRHLIAQHPDRDDLKVALKGIEQQMAARRAPTRKDVELLMREWVDMIQDQQRQVSRRRNKR